MIVEVCDDGTRGYVLAQTYLKSPHVDGVVIAGGRSVAKLLEKKFDKPVFIEPISNKRNSRRYLEIAQKYRVDLVDVAQDEPVAFGVADLMHQNGIDAFGPTARANQLEASKFAQKIRMLRYRIPTARFLRCDSEGEGFNAVRSIYALNPDDKNFVKADGLARGQGALFFESIEEGDEMVRRMKLFPNQAGSRFLVEIGLKGEEFSKFGISDGYTVLPFKSANDNKLSGEGDTGEQTGGMGGNCPALVTAKNEAEVNEVTLNRLVKGMSKDVPYVGILYAGGMMVDDKPHVIEYNARWGDPEIQMVVHGVENDYVELVQAARTGQLHNFTLKQDNLSRVCIVVASKGYPRDYPAVLNQEIHGLNEIMQLSNIDVFFGGVELTDGHFIANGGRLLSVVGRGNNVVEASDNAYAAAERLYAGSPADNLLFYRHDIAHRDRARFLQNAPL